MELLQLTPIGWNEVIGRWHPVLVHLPIGILLIAVILEFLGRRPRYSAVRQGVGPALFLGMLSAVASCVAGYCLSLSGGYEDRTLATHQWLGFGVAAASLGLWWLYLRRGRLHRRGMRSLLGLLWILLPLLLVAAGHYGGSLTHGSAYLAQTFPTFLQKSLYGHALGAEGRVSIPNIQDARVYPDVIRPILATRCYSCHSARKTKGALRLDSIAYIREGGEDGPVLSPGQPEQSELFRRIMLAEGDDEHMPPLGKPQLSIHQALLLRWWIEQGCPFDKKVSELAQPPAIQPILEALQEAGGRETSPYVPESEVAAAPRQAVEALQATGVKVMTVSAASHYLKANAVNAPAFGDAETALLLPLREQLAWLELGHTGITNKGLATIGRLTALTRLQLEGTSVTDSGLVQLKSLKRLRYLNLTGTSVTDKGLEALAALQALHVLYLFRTQVTPSAVEALQQRLPELRIDTGHYVLPLIAADTLVY